MAELSIWHTGQPTEKSAGSTSVIHGFSPSRWSPAPTLLLPSFLNFYFSPTKASSTCSRLGRVPGPWGDPGGGLGRAGRVLRGAWGSGASTPRTPPPIQRRAGPHSPGKFLSPATGSCPGPEGAGQELRTGMEGTEGGTGFGGIRSLKPTPLTKVRGPPRSANRFHPPRRVPTWASSGPVGDALDGHGGH